MCVSIRVCLYVCMTEVGVWRRCTYHSQNVPFPSSLSDDEYEYDADIPQQAHSEPFGPFQREVVSNVVACILCLCPDAAAVRGWPQTFFFTSSDCFRFRSFPALTQIPEHHCNPGNRTVTTVSTARYSSQARAGTTPLRYLGTMGLFHKPENLSNLTKYVYSASDASYMYASPPLSPSSLHPPPLLPTLTPSPNSSNYVLQPWWRWAVTLLPLWMAPNLVTLIGFSWPVLNYLIFATLAPSMTEALPGWAYVSVGVGLFFYSTMDAIDGKQARRTGSSSPLGELFDHGCDAVNASVTTLVMVSILRLGDDAYGPLFLLTVSCVMFFTATLEEYHTHTLALGIINGPTEGVFLMIFLAFYTAANGTGMWVADANDVLGTQIPLLDGRSFNQVAIMGVLPIAVLTVFTNLAACVTHKKHGSLSLFGLAVDVIPIVTIFGSAWTWAVYSPSRIVQTSPWVTLSAIGILSALSVGRVIVSHLLLCPTPALQPILLLPLAVVANSVAPAFGLLPAPLLPEITAAWILLAASLLTYAVFTHEVITAFTSHLNIACFSIPYPPKKAQ